MTYSSAYGAPGFAMNKKTIFSLFDPLLAPLAVDFVISEKSALSLENSWGRLRDSAKERCRFALRLSAPATASRWSRGKISDLGFQVFPKHVQVELMEIDSLVMSWKTKLIKEGSIR
jgi:hypothetical protein